MIFVYDEFHALRDRKNHRTTAHINLSGSQHTMSGMTTPDQLNCSDPSGVQHFKSSGHISALKAPI